MKTEPTVKKLLSEIKDFNPYLPIDTIDMFELYLNMAYGVGFNRGRTLVKHMKAVIQLDKLGVPIREFESAAEASRILQINKCQIRNVCNGTHGKKSAGGYKWVFK